MRSEVAIKASEIAVQKFASNVDLYFPKFSMLQEQFEEFKSSIDGEVAHIKG